MKYIFTSQLLKVGTGPIQKTIHMLKFVVFFLWLGMMGTYATSYSQSISVNIKNGKLTDLFEAIQKQTDYSIIYKDKLIDKRSLTLNATNKDVNEILKEAFKKTDLNYQIYEKQITVLSNIAGKIIVDPLQDSLYTVRGRIFDTKEPPSSLPGVTILVKGTSRGTTSDAQGYYTIKAHKGEVLQFSIISYLPYEYTVNGSQNNLTIALKDNTSSLEQVIVIGMTELQKKHIASSVGSLKTESNIAGKPITNLSQALQGGITGVQVQQGSGLPGGDAATIKIRGIGTLNNSNPLILVDGIPMDMNHIDPVTVESVTVLKDAAAASIYGARAANGVILVTTKRGMTGKVTVTYDGYSGIQTPNILPQFVDAPTYMRMYNYALAASNQATVYTSEEIEKTASGKDPINYPNTNWTDEVIDKYAPITSHSLSIMGGSDVARFAVTGNYMYQKGMLPVNKMERYNLRANTSISLGKKVLLNLDILAIKRNTLYPNRPLDNGGIRMLDDLYRLPPNILPKYPKVDGFPQMYGRYADIVNPIAYAEKGGSMGYEFAQNTVNLHPKWEILPGLNLRGQFSFRLNSDVYTLKRDNFYFFDYYTEQLVQTWDVERNAYSQTRDTYYYLSGSADYSYTKDNHRVFALGGYSQESFHNGFWDKSALLSTYLKSNYSFDDRYLLEASIRMDGSSKFGPGKKHGFFPSFALGWNIHNENFFKAEAVSNFKIRGSYGQLGNENIGLYRYQNLINATNGLEGAGGNPDITWEKVTIVDIGADLGFFNNTLEITADFYDKLTSDILLEPNVALSGGLAKAFLNAGKVRNRGFELAFNYNKSINDDCYFSVGPGFTYNTNKITELYGGPFYNGINVNQIGYPISSFYGYKSEGLLQYGDFEVDRKTAKAPVLPGQQGPGDIKYVDINKNGIIDADDQEIIGDPTPKFNYFANVSFRWKKFDVEFLFQGAGKHDYSANLGGRSAGYLWNPINLSMSGGVPTTYRAANSWKENNMDAIFPRILANPEANVLRSDFWLFNAAYMRVKYLQLGYNLSGNMLKQRGIQAIRVYANAQNPFTFTKMAQADPETQGGSWTYSLMQVYTIGLHVTF